MDLKNNRITMQELLDNPKSRAILQKRFPEVFHLPIMKTSGGLTLERATKLAAAYVPRSTLQATIRELEML